jgi:hypothetical protein
MKNQRVDELAERVAALEDAIAGGRSSDLDARLLAIETALRRLSHGEEELEELGDVLASCNELLEERVPAGGPVMVVWRGDPAVLALRSRPIVPFPRPIGALADHDFEHGAGPIAHLEAQRARGIRFLLIPDQARLWLEELPSFQEHLSCRYALLADAEGAGLLFEIGERRSEDRSSEGLVETLDRILDGERYAPVLDWTAFGLDSVIKERGIFTPPTDADGELPYLDRSIEVVVVDEPTHLDEGRRVATSAVVLVQPEDEAGVRVTEVQLIGDAPETAPEVTLIEMGADWRLRAGEVETPLVAFAEDGIQPLPGCLEAAAATLQHDESAAAVAMKLMDADGLLEAAGLTVFADGSVEGIGAGSAAVSAPWHEYVRPVCGGSGLLVVRATALAEKADETSLVELSGRLWADGHRVVYQPDAWAVRVTEREGSDGAAEPGGPWAEVLPSRPERPDALDDSTWRWLLAHDDIEEAWR